MNAAAVASALLAIALVVLWVRSHVHTESWSVEASRRYAVRTDAGRLMLEREWQFAGRIVEQSPPPTAVSPVDPGGVAAALGDPMTSAGRGLRGPPAMVTIDTVTERPMRSVREWSHVVPDLGGWPWMPPQRQAVGVGWANVCGGWRYSVAVRSVGDGGGRFDRNGRWVLFGPVRHEFDFNMHQATRLAQLTIPLWLATLLALALPGARVGLAVRRRRRPPPGHCRRCGYDLRASPDRCPECGAGGVA